MCTALVSHIFVSEEVRPATGLYCTPTECRGHYVRHVVEKGPDGIGNASLETFQELTSTRML